jgi:hypothetical protein
MPLFAEDAPRVWAILGEEALRRPAGGPAVLLGQRRRVRELARLPHFSLRVVPIEAGGHPALGCPFNLLYLEHARATIGYVESLTNGEYIKAPHAYTLAFEHAGRVALSEDETLARLDRLIADLE